MNPTEIAHWQREDLAPPDLIVRPYKRPDWFVITREMAQYIGYSPGVQFDERSGAWIAHRNQLPLFGAAPSQGNHAEKASWVAGSPLFGDGTTQLRPHQESARAFLSARRGSLEADSMRLGKTGACIAAHDPDLGSMVVVAPLATRRVWTSWFARRWPDEPVVVLTGRTYDPDPIRDAKLVFLHYDILPGWTSLGINRRIGTLVFDEAHLLSNRRSRRTQTATVMAPQAERIIAVTGTPLWNQIAGLFSLVNLVNPGAWGTFSEWTARYADGRPSAYGWVTGKATNVEEFRARMSEVMIRRVWAELEADLVPTHRKLYKVSVDKAHQRELDLISAALASEADGQTLVGQLARYRRLLGNVKAHAAAERAAYVAQTEPVVVWVWHKRVADRVKAFADEKSIPSWIVTGDTVDDQREGIYDAWEQCQNGVLIMSLGVGQVGIDLSHARHAIFAELDWTPAVVGQAEMRTFSPLRGDTIEYVVADHEIDLKLAGVLADKCEQAKLVGTPAADTAIDVIGQMMRGPVADEADLNALAAKIVARVRREGTTFV